MKKNQGDVIGSSTSLIERFVIKLNAEFVLNDLGSLNFFLGIEAIRDTTGIHLCQKKYVRDLLSKQGMLKCKSVSIPITPKAIQESTSSYLSDPHEYRVLVGALQYLSITRPDITYVINVASQHMQCPTANDFSALKRILRCLVATPNHGIHIRPCSRLQLSIFSNSDCSGCPLTRRSTSGFCSFLGSNLISWSSKKQPTVARSSIEAEYRSIATAAAEVTWLQFLLRDLQVQLPAALIAYCDNTSATYLAYNHVMHSRSKHIAIDYHFVREKVALGDLTVLHVLTHKQLADVFTKPLSTSKFHFAISNLFLSIPTQLEGGCKPHKSLSPALSAQQSHTKDQETNSPQ
ncbi:transmembrane signal receptor [Lithospermum erythrorhizon]|uniref:Transmembrane signal receptor n=1 Tax=Lithospermum erythrorhizon TaxID=34254 RepID=A0AAV3RNH5_LITER